MSNRNDATPRRRGRSPSIPTARTQLNVLQDNQQTKTEQVCSQKCESSAEGFNILCKAVAFLLITVALIFGGVVIFALIIDATGKKVDTNHQTLVLPLP